MTEIEYEPGDRIEHSNYGTGTVRTTDHVGVDALDGANIVVEFDGAHDKRIVDARDCTEA